MDQLIKQIDHLDIFRIIAVMLIKNGKACENLDLLTS